MMQTLGELISLVAKNGDKLMPWLTIILIVWLFIQIKPMVQKYIEYNMMFRERYAQEQGVLGEIIKNNTATIESCTAVLTMVTNDNISLEVTMKDRLDKIEQRLDTIELDNKRIIDKLNGNKKG